MFELQIERGAAILDAKVPEWRDRIDRPSLDMGDPCGCMIGQLFDVPEEEDDFSGTLPEEYTAALALLGIEDDVDAFGLDLSEDQIMTAARTDGVADLYGRLGQEWLDGPLAEDGP